MPRAVLVGVGQVRNKPGLDGDFDPREPALLMAEALGRAARDAGCPELLTSADLLMTVAPVAWVVDDLPGRVAELLGARPREARVDSGPCLSGRRQKRPIGVHQEAPRVPPADGGHEEGRVHDRDRPHNRSVVSQPQGRLEELLHRRVVGQDEAVRAVADAVLRARSGIKDPNRPIGSFLFLGPTGVGKTELARALAATLFDDEANLIRIDMSEYMEKHTVARLIGAPPGYVGYEEGGQLTEAVRRRPYCVILFDEIEKAHHDVFNVLLQVLDDGRLTDSQGRTVDFKNTVLIMTSNLGSQDILETQQRGGTYDEMRQVVMAELHRNFRPEFLNRVDETVVFHPLTSEHLAVIVDIQVARLRERLMERRIPLVLTPSATTNLAERGSDPVYGARPLKRLIQQDIETPIARLLVKGELHDGDTATVDVKNGQVVVVPTVESRAG